MAFLSQSKFAGKQTKPIPDPEPPVKGGIEILGRASLEALA